MTIGDKIKMKKYNTILIEKQQNIGIIVQKN